MQKINSADALHNAIRALPTVEMSHDVHGP